MKVLVVGDIHTPAEHPGYLAFCKDLRKKYKTNTTIFIGDVADMHAISFHAANPHCPGPEDERLLTKQCIQRWYKAFPKATVTIGNHDARVIRLAESVNIPSRFIRDYAEVWNTPGWNWVEDAIIDDVYYMHGTGRSGMHPAFNAMKDMLMSVCMGHCHAASGIKWRANPHQRTFGLDTGCGVDVDAYQMVYGKHMRSRPILSAAVVVDGMPFHHVMDCGPGERYHKSKFTPTKGAKR
jgi:hypothetical protein